MGVLGISSKNPTPEQIDRAQAIITRDETKGQMGVNPTKYAAKLAVNGAGLLTLAEQHTENPSLFARIDALAHLALDAAEDLAPGITEPADES